MREEKNGEFGQSIYRWRTLVRLKPACSSGAKDVFQWIENNLAGKFTEHILVVHGQRRVGKTSVLKQLGSPSFKEIHPHIFRLAGANTYHFGPLFVAG